MEASSDGAALRAAVRAVADPGIGRAGGGSPRSGARPWQVEAKGRAKRRSCRGEAFRGKGGVGWDGRQGGRCAGNESARAIVNSEGAGQGEPMTSDVLAAESAETAAPSEAEQRYRRLYPIAYRVALQMLGSAADAEDLVQEVWLAAEAALQRPGQGTVAHFDAWVRRIAVNRAINFYKSKWFRVLRGTVEVGEAAVADGQASPEQMTLNHDAERRLAEALQTLSAPARHAFVLHFRGHTYEEIARLMDCPVGTAKIRVHRAREKLSLRLQEDELPPLEDEVRQP